jgi:hypothetical protein
VSSQPGIVSLKPNDLVGVFRDICKVAEALGAGPMPGWWPRSVNGWPLSNRPRAGSRSGHARPASMDRASHVVHPIPSAQCVK